MEPRPRVQGGSQQAKLYGWRGERAVVIAEKRGVRREGWGAEKEVEGNVDALPSSGFCQIQCCSGFRVHSEAMSARDDRI